MKNQAATFLKQVVSVMSSVLKSKTNAVKNKACAIKTRQIIFGLLRNKKILLATIAHKIHVLLGQERGDDVDLNDQNKVIVVYNPMSTEGFSVESCAEPVEEDYYPNLTHSLFDSEEVELENQGGSIIDMVKKSSNSSDFSLEDEIDNVADLFIKRFHRRLLIQKQQSFKRYQEMLAGV